MLRYWTVTSYVTKKIASNVTNIVQPVNYNRAGSSAPASNIVRRIHTAHTMDDHNVNEPTTSTEQGTDSADKYLTNGLKRSPLQSKGEEAATKNLLDRLTTVRSHEVLQIRDGTNDSCPKCRGAKQRSSRRSFRKVTLFTLSHGSPTIAVEDWYCISCAMWVHFRGESDAIFPVTKSSAYTTELLYAWVHIVCFQGLSFRSAYMNT